MKTLKTRFNGLYVAAAAASLLAISAGAAQADVFAGDFDVTYNQTDPGLVIAINPIASLNNGLNFNLTNAGDVAFVDLFEIYTLETYVNNPLFFGCEDSCPKLIDVAMNFTLPAAFGGNIPGTTNGVSMFGGYLQRGEVVWDNGGIQDFAFGNGGMLRVKLDSGIFNEGVGSGFLGLQDWGLDPGLAEAAIVTAKYELLSPSAAVPEPATWAMMILGFGSAGAVLRRKRDMQAALA